MTQKPPMLQQVEGTGTGAAGSAIVKQLGDGARDLGPSNASGPGPAAASTPEIYEMLAELRRDLDARRAEQPSSQGGDDGELFSMMSDLRRDMSVLKRSAVSIRPAGTSRPAGTGAIPAAKVPAPRAAQPPSVYVPVYDLAPEPSFMRKLFSEEKRPALSLATALAIAVSGLYLITNRGPAAATLAAAPALVATGSTSVAGVTTGTALFEALSAGASSPQGISAKGVTATRALSRANAQLQIKGAARDTQEAAFWLKRYMTDTLGDVRMARALTQLGATYAEQQNDKAAGYVKARQLWEMAGALGDPVAMCFLGRLFENGWSVAANSTTALRWFERARDAGGCPGVEDSIARVQ